MLYFKVLIIIIYLFIYFPNIVCPCNTHKSKLVKAKDVWWWTITPQVQKLERWKIIPQVQKLERSATFHLPSLLLLPQSTLLLKFSSLLFSPPFSPISALILSLFLWNGCELCSFSTLNASRFGWVGDWLPIIIIPITCSLIDALLILNSVMELFRTHDGVPRVSHFSAAIFFAFAFVAARFILDRFIFRVSFFFFGWMFPWWWMYGDVRKASFVVQFKFFDSFCDTILQFFFVIHT